jgi:predicted transglutaminase-like cysteine proteinase
MRISFPAAPRRLLSLFFFAAAMAASGNIGRSEERAPQSDKRTIVSFPRGPAQYFTINEVLGLVGRPSALRLPLADDEPFGLTAFVQPEGMLWEKWRKLVAEMDLEKAALARCIADGKLCAPATERFYAIVMSARHRTGRARLELVNERVNAAIRYKSDEEQWGVPDRWSSPLSTFETGFGDCEDYVIAKYVALHESGVPPEHLRMVLGYHQQRMTGHAVLAVRDGDDWLILDQPAYRLVAAVDMDGYVPLFSFGTRGVRLLVMPYVGHAMAAVETVGAAPEKALDLSKRAGLH